MWLDWFLGEIPDGIFAILLRWFFKREICLLRSMNCPSSPGGLRKGRKAFLEVGRQNAAEFDGCGE